MQTGLFDKEVGRVYHRFERIVVAEIEYLQTLRGQQDAGEKIVCRPNTRRSLQDAVGIGLAAGSAVAIS